MAIDFKYHSDIVTKQWKQFSQSIQTKDKDKVILTGLHLDLSDVLAVSRLALLPIAEEHSSIAHIMVDMASAFALTSLHIAHWTQAAMLSKRI